MPKGSILEYLKSHEGMEANRVQLVHQIALVMRDLHTELLPHGDLKVGQEAVRSQSR